MGSLNRLRSAHQADIKGKGILYEDDDAPIKLVDRDDSFVIKEFGLALIGKILNPKKQNVEKLLQTMPSQWGGRIGHVDTLELTEGRMLIDVDSRRPLKFSRKLFKHCTTCGLLSHEKGYCPNVDVRSRLQHVERPVFSRLQQNQDVSRQNWGRDALANTRATQQSSLQSRGIQSSRYYTSKPLRSDDRSTWGQVARYWEDDSSRGRHSDRIIRSRDDHSRRSRYGGARGAGPYARPSEKIWRARPKLHDRLGRNQIEGDSATNAGSTSREIVPYERSPTTTSPTNVGLAETRSGERLTYRKLASTIVTPVRAEQPMENNVTLRGKGEARTIVFSPSGSAETSHPDDLIIGALSNMELMDQSEGALAADGADGDDGDDLLELDLMVLEESKSQPRPIEDSGRSSWRATRSKKPGVRRNTPLGIKNRKFEVLRRGSPSKHSTATGSHVAGGGGKLRRHLGSNKAKDKALKLDGMEIA
ncbi:hypothetical protein Bca52824_048077 [Brassica carinata]|uniref:Zinc knuckle CX2CX4HX4C domain-containing protein n=1 Tax=Brassica carinata TaxID=52824 RepID=A0A8X7RFU2_BRACI|nr:hypothetical protein Bca52824_048077 [Brassica carinata]